MRLIIVGLVLIVLVVSGSVSAGVFAYECEVLAAQQISDEGYLQSGPAIYNGSTFNVERKTGLVVSAVLDNSTYPTINVLDAGGESMSYKVIWISKRIYGRDSDHHNVVYLQIKEFSEAELKPFILVLSATVLTGTCR